MHWKLAKRIFIIGIAATAVAFVHGACSSSSDNTTTTITEDTSYDKGLDIPAGDSLVIDDSSDDGSTIITIDGDFNCAGTLDVRDTDAAIYIDVSGNADLSCDIEFPTTGTGSSRVDMVVDGLITISDGFNPLVYGSVIIVDDVALLKTPTELEADALVDDGVSPVIMKPADTAGATDFTSDPDPTFDIMARDCTEGAHTISGSWVPTEAISNLNQGASQGPLVFSVWTECDLNMDNFEIDPPIWADPPETDGQGIGEDPDAASGADGRKGMTLNARTNGKMNFSGGSVLNLMDGGAGQPATHTGDPAIATGGKGGKSGDMKIQAGGGFTFAEGATLTINPGKGGDGGDATATGTAGVAGCPGTKGGDATATAGDGGDNTKKLTIRGVTDPGSKIIIGGIEAGIGGAGDATGGDGGAGDPGECDGGAGGDATASGGNGGASSFSGSGTGTLAPEVYAGDGGDAGALAGKGGKGGENEPNKGGDGGDGGESLADAGRKGTETGGTPMGQADDGTPSTNLPGGVGGDCGKCDGVGGEGGTWDERIDGVSQDSDTFEDGSSDCECEEELCGNTVINAGEDCDTNNLNGETCQSQGFDTGELACTSGCAFDTSGCENIADPICGDDAVNQVNEDCDGTDLDGEDCVSQGFSGGTLACDSGCNFDTSGCESGCTQGDDLISLVPGSVTINHIYGGTSCPQNGPDVEIQNVSTEIVSLELTSNHPDLGPITVQPIGAGGTDTFNPVFTCTSPHVATEMVSMTLFATSEGGCTQQLDLNVTINISGLP